MGFYSVYYNDNDIINFKENIMALTKKPVTVENEVVAAGGFEDVDANEQGGETEAANATAPSTTDKVKVEAATAIAKAQNTAVGAPTKRVLKALDQFKTDEPVVDWDEATRVVASAGKFSDDKGNKLGTEIEIDIQAWNDQYVISPGDSKEAKDFVKYSVDGINLRDGEGLVSDYINRLKIVEGFPDAKVKQYLTVVAVLEKCTAFPKHEGTYVQLSLSPSSRKEFNKYSLNTALKVNKGLIDPDAASKVKVTIGDGHYDGNDYNFMEFSAIN